MRPRPTFDPWPGSSIPFADAKRSFDAELMAWAAEVAQDAANRIEQSVKPRKTKYHCDPGLHTWSWMGGGHTFCTRCGMETHL